MKQLNEWNETVRAGQIVLFIDTCFLYILTFISELSKTKFCHLNLEETSKTVCKTNPTEIHLLQYVQNSVCIMLIGTPRFCEMTFRNPPPALQFRKFYLLFA